MYERKNLKPLEGEIGSRSLKIPDEDLPNWARILMDGGFSRLEIEKFLINHNLTYNDGRFRERLKMSGLEPNQEERELIDAIEVALGENKK